MELCRFVLDVLRDSEVRVQWTRALASACDGYDYNVA